MASSALIVKVPEAEEIVGWLRARFDKTSELGVPAHITILFPFMPPDRVTPAVLDSLRAAFAIVPAFSYKLASIGRFEATTYLVPSPAEPFIALTSSAVRQFPEFPPYGGQHAEIIPHLTVAAGDAQSSALAATELAASMRARPVIQARCNAVSMLENSSGRWQETHVFKLCG